MSRCESESERERDEARHMDRSQNPTERGMKREGWRKGGNEEESEESEREPTCI